MEGGLADGLADADALADAENAVLFDAIEVAEGFDRSAIASCEYRQVIAGAYDIVLRLLHLLYLLLVVEGIAFGNQVGTVAQGACGEVDQQFGIDGVAEIAYLIMQV